MPWYAYAAVTPLFYSISNYIDKFLLEKKIRNPFALTVISGTVSGLIGLVVWGIKGFQFIGFFPSAMMLLAGALLIFYLLPYLAAMKEEDASTVVPLFQFIPVFTLILSSVILHEVLTARQIAGLLAVVAAGIFISLKRVRGNIFQPRKALLYMLAASFLYGSVGILFRLVIKGVDFWTAFSYQYMGTGLISLIILLVYPAIRRQILEEKRAFRAGLGIIVLNNVISIIAQLAELFAVSLVAVPLVNIVGGIQPLISFLEGIALTLLFPGIIREEIGKATILQKAFSILLMFFGLYLVYAS